MCLKHSGEILSDASKTGRERPWQLHKRNSVLLADSYERIGLDKKSDKVRNCGNYLKFNVCPSGHEKKLKFATFCRVRLCPMCSWRRSLKIAHQLKMVSHHAASKQKLRWLFLTLTARTVPGGQLKERIDLMMKSWDRLCKRAVFKRSILGWFRGLEVTYNPLAKMFHPHFHVALAVSPRYFVDSRLYINQREWSSLWQKSMRLDYVPIVDVRIVKPKKRDVAREAAILIEKGIDLDHIDSYGLSDSVIAECAKYVSKSNDYLIYNEYEPHKKKKNKFVPVHESGIDEDETDYVVSLLDKVLAYRKLVRYGGILEDSFNDLREMNKVDDVDSDDADLVHVDGDLNCKCSVCNSNMLEELYSWLPGLSHYVKIEDY